MCDHEWIVYSTAIAVGCLMLECKKCKALATVNDPTKEEWSRAFHAPSNPYEWDGGDDRVEVQ